jgi:hypothetical protein
MKQDGCRQCHATGIVSVTGALYSTEASVACSCNAGNAIWDVVLEIASGVEQEQETRRLPIERVNEQIRSKLIDQRTQKSSVAADTVRTINVTRDREPAELMIRIWGSKK